VPGEFARESGIRIINDLGAAFFTYPGHSFGIAFEIYDGDFKQLAQPARYWETQHPLGLTGLARLSVAVESVEAAVTRLHELAEVSEIGPVTRPRASARGVQMQVGTAVWELLEPTGDGPLADYLGRYGQRIRSTVFKAGNLTAVEKHLTAQGFDLIPGRRGRRAGHQPGSEQEPAFGVHRVDSTRAAAGQRTCWAPSAAALGPAGPGAYASRLAGTVRLRLRADLATPACHYRAKELHLEHDRRIQGRHPGQGQQVVRGSGVHGPVSRSLVSRSLSWRVQQRTGLP
jgi:hypothetical protein